MAHKKNKRKPSNKSLQLPMDCDIIVRHKNIYKQSHVGNKLSYFNQNARQYFPSNVQC